MVLRDGFVTHSSVTQRYRLMVEDGRLNADPAQEKLAAALDRILADIETRRLARKSSALGWLFARKRPRTTVQGLYVHGSVGGGKTMLMDLFFALVPARRKRRVHFNDFMADVHDRIDRQRKTFRDARSRSHDPIPPVAEAIAQEAWILCFDEFSVTDIADAMILSRLFSALFQAGVILVATSNVAPEDLYRDGLNRGLFMPFIDILKKHTTVLELRSDRDYRLDKLNRLPVYVVGEGEEADRRMDEAWAAVSEGHAVHRTEIALKGRLVEVPRSAGRAARFTFRELCGQPLGARDFMAIAENYDTLVIDRVPVMSRARRNEAKRFILLVDVLYDQHKRVFISAAAPPEALYPEKSGTEAFEFQRTASRLIEMQSHDWLEAMKPPRQPQEPSQEQPPERHAIGES